MAPALAPTSTSARSSLSLTLATPDGTILKRYNSLNGPVQLGRGHKNSSDCRSVNTGRFRLAGSEVMSSKQATLTWEDNMYAIITDNSSTNGTYLDRQGEQQRKLQAGANYRLNHGDTITFGQSVQSSKAERKCEPTPLRVAITFDDDVQPSSAEPIHAAVRVRSSSPEGIALDRRGTFTGRPYRRRSTTSTDSDEHEHWHAGTMRAPLSSGFGISEDDLLQSNNEEEGEVEVVEVVEEVTTLKSITVKGRAEAVKRRAAPWSDSDDGSIEVVYAEPRGETITLPDTDSEAAGTSSDMQIDDDDEDEDVDMAVASDVESRAGGETVEAEEDYGSMPGLDDIESDEEEGDEDEEQNTLGIDGEPTRAESPLAEDEEEAMREHAKDISVDSPPSQRLPSPVSPEQLSSRALAEASPPPSSIKVPVLEALLSDDTRAFPPSQIKQKHSLFRPGGFFDKLAHSKKRGLALPSKPRSNASADTKQSSRLTSVAVDVDDDVASQTSHLPSPTSSVEPELSAEEQHEDADPWDGTGDWGSSIFKAAEEDSAAASERGGESRALSVSLFGDDDMPRGEDTDFFDEVEDQYECEEDKNGEYEENYFNNVGSEDEDWFDRDAPEGDDEVLASDPSEMSYSEGEDAESAPAPHLKFMAIDSLGAPIVPIASRSPAFSPSFSPAPPLSRKRNISTVDTSTSTEPDLLHRAEAIALPIAPLPKRRRIVRDLGHVTLGFGLGVVAAVAGLSALSGAIQAMDV